MVAISSNRDTVMLRASYDGEVDVLHLASGVPADVEGDDLPGGIELDYSVADGHPCGVTIIGYVRNGWDRKVTELSGIVARHLSVDPQTVVDIVRSHAPAR